MYPAIEQQVERFIRTGEFEDLPYGTVRERLDVERREGPILRNALLDEVRKRTDRIDRSNSISDLRAREIITARLQPLVKGLLPKAEEQKVLGFLAKSFVVVTGENIETTINSVRPKMGWLITNGFLKNMGAEPLCADRIYGPGATDEGTAYVSLGVHGSDSNEQAPGLDDFIVHEAAHLMLMSTRTQVGLPDKDRKFVLEVEVPKRELFAYSCEFYSRAIAISKRRKDRLKLLSAMGEFVMFGHEYVNRKEVLSLVTAAIQSNDGWWLIRKTCSEYPTSKKSRKPSST